MVSLKCFFSSKINCTAFSFRSRKPKILEKIWFTQVHESFSKFDGAILVHVLARTTITTFQQYAEQVFVKFLRCELQTVNRVDVVWDRYLDVASKEQPDRSVVLVWDAKSTHKTKIPLKWNDFLRDSSNKIELFSLLTNTAARQEVADKKDLYISSDESIVSAGNASSMPNCNHEEADTRIGVHLLHSVQMGNKKILVKTVYTDIIIIFLGKIWRDVWFVSRYWFVDCLWCACKDFALYSVNAIYDEIGQYSSGTPSVSHVFRMRYHLLLPRKR